MTSPSQPSLPLKVRHRHGGARAGAGRPRKPDAGVSHAPRARLANRHPVHVTMRAVAGAPNLRRGAAWTAVEAALRGMRARGSCRVVHFSVQTNHLHLLVEAHDAAALSRGMQALAIRIARAVNAAAGRRGKLWGDRFTRARSGRRARSGTRSATCSRTRGATRTCGAG